MGGGAMKCFDNDWEGRLDARVLSAPPAASKSINSPKIGTICWRLFGAWRISLLSWSYCCRNVNVESYCLGYRLQLVFEVPQKSKGGNFNSTLTLRAFRFFVSLSISNLTSASVLFSSLSSPFQQFSCVFLRSIGSIYQLYQENGWF